jgi:hypothetical protein
MHISESVADYPAEREPHRWSRAEYERMAEAGVLILEIADSSLGFDVVAKKRLYGYERLTEQLSLPDPNDRHVLAAAIRCGAQAIVTMNVKDFPSEALAEFEIVPRHPDDFILDLADLEPAVVTAAAKLQRAALKDRPCHPKRLSANCDSKGYLASRRSCRTRSR